MSNSGGRFAPYRNALTAVSGRTGTPLPSLIISFAILHELTAIVPIVGIFYTARSLNAGERAVNAVALKRDGSIDDQYWVNARLRSWVDEGEQWAGRVGRRYGIFGFEKGKVVDQTQTSELSGKLAGDVANAVLAYGAVKSNWLFKDLFHLWRCLIPWGERFYLVLVFRATCDFSGAHLDGLGTCPTFRL
ncbi:uncharacterized protein F5891DRAFT_1057295 [Suillus fuscotomentosus]|uniref:Uncharacterized protein n=1 Tax=Suillus fuscotomentosus TaxID=1912939 RepID=A0AAD4HGR0_9AGAM|nr:uncharacterized protein F5891DRAFT_1057295 [Suillus fuscotomentosus]KAG1895616.1 hypothetical protein F5891DRAFT_1057295 [Suillus fuscotomentosus]